MTDISDRVSSPPGRYAVYYAPDIASDEWQEGSRWLGRCAATGQLYAPVEVDGLAPEQVHGLTAAPRRYGWHGTLRAPFALAPGVTSDDLLEALLDLAGQWSAFEMPALGVVLIDDFLALVPDPACSDTARLNALAGACVTSLQPLAAPLSPSDLARRRAAGLSPEQDALLLRWGYPFVLDQFRFHVSLTGSLRNVPAGAVQALKAKAERIFAGLPAHRFDTLALFHEAAPGADFTLIKQVALAP